ncbi:hypothetical protein BDN72DRAFT_906897 [Pluteus cervinus]|uniref:Uncharacterized protein n=1 Tax=Pluteus cervinus TaxID=181527 RepID=A0ACD2ZYS2_9AGAR|nr:hypothetical protein BDN72DRAFT_906897 [Pluteus cervinus]
MVRDDVTTWAVLYPTLLPLPLGGNSGQISDRVVSIWQKRNVGPVVKWCDDFATFRPRKKYGYTKQSALKLVKELNVPWHAEKGQDFASTFTHVGLEWDIENKMVVLPEKKSKMLQQVEGWFETIRIMASSSDQGTRARHYQTCEKSKSDSFWMTGASRHSASNI